MCVKIAVLPLGDPSLWTSVEYCLENTKSTDKCIEGTFTLDLLVKKLDYKNILILVPWTLIPQEELKKHIEESLVQEEPIYCELANRVKKYINDNICGKIESNCEEIRIRVLPGIFRLYSKDFSVVFKTRIDNLKNNALYELYREINNMLGETSNVSFKEGADCLNVLLDTTHGVNYFILTIREVLDQVLALIAVSKQCRVMLSIYNADPFRRPKSSESDKDIKPRLHYHKIAEKIYIPWHVSIHAKFLEREHNIILKNSNEKSSVKFYGGEDENEVLRSAKRIVTAYRLGLVPILMHLVGTNINLRDRIDNLVNKAIESWRENIVLNKLNDKNAIVSTKQNLSDGFRLLLYARAIFSGVLRFLEENKINNIVIEGIKLDDLKKLVETLYEGMEIINETFSHECKNIKKYISKIEEEWRLIADLKRKKKEDKKESNPVKNYKEDIGTKMERVKRHTIAHAGFNEKFIELKKINKDIRVRIYRDREEDILKLLDKLFEDNLVIKMRSIEYFEDKQ